MFFCLANVDLSDVVALSKKSRTQVYSGSSRKTAGPQGTLCVHACMSASGYCTSYTSNIKL